VFAMSDIIAIAAFPVTLVMRRYTSLYSGTGWDDERSEVVGEVIDVTRVRQGT
jgi:hypothetical protein